MLLEDPATIAVDRAPAPAASAAPRPRGTGAHLIAYADRLGGDLAGLARLLDGPLAPFDGVHVLPFFTPYDGADDGFDPEDHLQVDPRLGTWEDVARLAEGRQLCADLVVNHVSDASPMFRDWLQRGSASPWDGMFLTFDSVFPLGASEADLTSVFRPRPGLPVTPYLAADGTRRLLWTTFDAHQVDLDVRHAATRAYLEAVLDRLAAAGASQVRLDAVGYAVKTPGTSMFLTDETMAFVDELSRAAHERGLATLVEYHGPWGGQLRLARHCDRVYDFALPPLVLHALDTGDAEPLGRWLAVRPPSSVNVLDTHDGIGLVDLAGAADGDDALLDEAAITALVARIDERTRGVSSTATPSVPWRRLPYMVNTTWFDAVGRDLGAYLAARVVQVLLPGTPQIYYVGLLAGSNDADLLAATHKGRDVNRHRYSEAEVATALRRPVVAALMGLVRLRGTHPAFTGEGQAHAAGSEVRLRWAAGAERVEASVDVAAHTFEVAWTTEDGGWRRASDLSGLADLT